MVVLFNPSWPRSFLFPLIHNKDRGDGCVEILIWLGDYLDFPVDSVDTWDAYVYNSTGVRCYQVHLFVGGYWVNGPGLYYTLL